MLCHGPTIARLPAVPRKKPELSTLELFKSLRIISEILARRTGVVSVPSPRRTRHQSAHQTNFITDAFGDSIVIRIFEVGQVIPHRVLHISCCTFRRLIDTILLEPVCEVSPFRKPRIELEDTHRPNLIL